MVGAITPFQQTFNTGQFAGTGGAAGTRQADAPQGGGNLNSPSGSAPLNLPPAVLARELAAALAEIVPKGDRSALDGASPSQAARLQSVLASAVSGDTASFLARAMLKFESAQRHATLLDKQSLGISAQSQLMASAGKLDQEASQTRSAALVSLITTVVSAAVTIGTAGVGGAMKGSSLGKEIGAIKSEIRSSEKASAAEEKADFVSEQESNPNLSRSDKAELRKMNAEAHEEAGAAQRDGLRAKIDAKEAEKTANIGMVVGQVGEGAAKALAAGGDYNSKLTEADNKTLEADAKRLDAAAENLRTQADGKKAMVDALNDLIQQVIAFVKDMADAKADRMQSITRA